MWKSHAFVVTPPASCVHSFSLYLFIFWLTYKLEPNFHKLFWAILDGSPTAVGGKTTHYRPGAEQIYLLLSLPSRASSSCVIVTSKLKHDGSLGDMRKSKAGS